MVDIKSFFIILFRQKLHSSLGYLYLNLILSGDHRVSTGKSLDKTKINSALAIILDIIQDI